ncbi:MAG TPA: glycosyltransferase family 9 protein [Acidimicrobiales bacterium]|nr:glycosyltransferase family 9 protein [Acidimicrobiales bacterium]
MKPGIHVLVARLDNQGDVLLAGPAVRAAAAGADRVTFLCRPSSEPVARMLPGVDDVVTFEAPWVPADPPPCDSPAVLRLVGRLASLEVDDALVLTSYHQSPLPLALLLRMARVRTVAGISADYPGSLLDVRHEVAEDRHEVERNLSLAATLGYRLPAGDDGRLRIVRRTPAVLPPDVPESPFVVVHPGASVPARAWAPERNAELVRALAAAGWPVVVTGGGGEAPLCAEVAGDDGVDLSGRTDVGGLADLLARAAAVVVGNTGPAHLAAAVGTPVVSLYAPTVPAVRWRPWRVPHELLGLQDIECAGCRNRVCPLPRQTCLDGVPVPSVVAAVDRLAAGRLVPA